MNVKVYSFPTLKDGRIPVEQAYCNLINAYRNGEKLEPEALDWMDSANTWLSSTSSKL